MCGQRLCGLTFGILDNFQTKLSKLELEFACTVFLDKTVSSYSNSLLKGVWMGIS